MITNERQYRISKAELERLRAAIKRFDAAEAASSLNGDRALAQAQLEALQSESEVLSEQLREYETLKSGSIRNLEGGQPQRIACPAHQGADCSGPVPAPIGRENGTQGAADPALRGGELFVGEPPEAG